jgi:hypothetical protein
LRAAFAAPGVAGFSTLTAADVLARLLPVDAHLTIDTGAHRVVLGQALRARWPGRGACEALLWAGVRVVFRA